MSQSWGHAVRRLTEAQAALDALHDWKCRTGKCGEPVTHITQYSYVTGRAGRVSFSQRRVCTGHAERFAAKHEIEIADAPKPDEPATAAGTDAR